MPVWHEAAREWVKQNRLVMIGIIQEQHPDRCRLFAQWQQFDWPILHDPINVLNASAVPILVALDEHGIVRLTRPKLEEFESAFLARSFPDDAAAADSSLTPSHDSDKLAAVARESDSVEAWRSLGDSLALWHTPRQVDAAISAYEHALGLDHSDLRSHFRLGVCLRMRHESERRRADDFTRAVASWERALAGNPNQYIWRRRIQQYGPRLIKPYPFYDWVNAAEAEIAGRGETPIALAVRPSGAEIAQPGGDVSAAENSDPSPDAGGAVFRDTRKLIQPTVTVVPSEVTAGSTARVHVSFVPNAERKAHWNNEAEPLRLWIDVQDGSKVEKSLLSTTPVAAPISSEVRRLDFELQVPETASSTVRLSTYALYYVCEDVDGQCLYLRQDVPIEIAVKPE